MISARTRLSAIASGILMIASPVAAAPVPTPPITPKPAGPMPVPYPDTPTPQPCPLVCLPKPAATLQLTGGASTIEVESFSWGAASVAVDGPTTVNTSDPQEGEIARTKPKMRDIPIVKRYDKSSPLMTSDPQEGGEAKPGSSPRDMSSGLATGKRQHMPIRMTRGSVDVTMPEGVCVAGSKYPAVTLRSGDKAYEMRDVTIASCTPVATAKGKKDKAKLDYMVVTMENVIISG